MESIVAKQQNCNPTHTHTQRMGLVKIMVRKKSIVISKSGKQTKKKNRMNERIGNRSVFFLFV